MEIQKNVSLKDKNWFQTGGSAEYFCQPKTIDEFVHALKFARKNNLNISLLGLGANVLISDKGIPGLVIKPQLQEIALRDDLRDATLLRPPQGSRALGEASLSKNGNKNPVCPEEFRGIRRSISCEDGCLEECLEGSSFSLITAQSGISLEKLITYCLDNNLVGLEEFAGIPGTVGGATYMNIHYFKKSWADVLVSAQIIEKESGKIITVDSTWFNYGYDSSTLQNKKYYLISATLQLKKTTDIETAYARGRCDEIIRQRNARYPTIRTCGSFFRNFHEHELNKVKNAKPLPFVAYYLDKLGIKGELSVGDAIVSPKHANMLENRGNATSHDIITLARTMQEMVHEKFGITPQPECQLLGFDMLILG